MIYGFNVVANINKYYNFAMVVILIWNANLHVKFSTIVTYVLMMIFFKKIKNWLWFNLVGLL